MNIIIPLGGKGERFSKNGYKEPKPLIPIFEKRMIEYVIDNIQFTEKDKIFIIYNYKLDNDNFHIIIKKKYPFIHLITVDDTKGAVETLYKGIETIFKNYNYNKKCLILDCDTFYTQDIVNIFRNSENNMVFYTKNYSEKAIYSYIQLNENSQIIEIREKYKISDNANTGAYAFNDINILFEFSKYVLENNICFNNEPYTSCVISEMIKREHVFIGKELNDSCVFSLGTPDSVNNFIDNRYAFLFDLDGTLVLTDDIYFNVWFKILSKFNLTLTHDIFKNYIQGNNDKYVLNTLLYNINININELSKLKDELFIENINKIKIVQGVNEIMKKIKLLGHKICIVTNCNRKVAETIINYIQIEHIIDFVITNDECKNAKPDIEPYLNASIKYNINNKKCFIFEDSKSGILSGKMFNPKILIGIETIYSSNEMKKYGVDFSIKNFENFEIAQLLDYKNDYSNDFIQMIKKNINLDNIQSIIFDDNKLKGGFIADVIGFKIITDKKIHSLVLKYENTETNNLSSMALQLQLYKREYYFYSVISNFVNIKIPKFVVLIKNEQEEDFGIILENLSDKKLKINLNLHEENIEVSLKIVDRMAKLHSNFWNKNLKKIFPELKKSDDIIFCPFFKNFISEKYGLFKQKWENILNPYQINTFDEIVKNFEQIQKRLSNNHLTFIHGDIKSPNIFYDIDNDYEPYFIDWQHCAIGKGTQDLIFFIIESFDISNIILMFNLFKNYYYKKILEYGIVKYTFEEYENDIKDALFYVPVFTAIWFGTIPNDELIDKNFPYFFINKLAFLIEYVTKK